MASWRVSHWTESLSCAQLPSSPPGAWGPCPSSPWATLSWGSACAPVLGPGGVSSAPLLGPGGMGWCAEAVAASPGPAPFRMPALLPSPLVLPGSTGRPSCPALAWPLLGEGLSWGPGAASSAGANSALLRRLAETERGTGEVMLQKRPREAQGGVMLQGPSTNANKRRGKGGVQGEAQGPGREAGRRPGTRSRPDRWH